eukprot:CAMPEP_0170472638 /NCGR_PEP_ID=MMETSP0123-20130129/14647_1 /TAXON_ID=182087 /ORGANISM="Favella ehrenbergii, Strain Fehren 1" /LENGTH=65 /DNA_ID=CAMNT_0010741065 /DNA_START=507 /DNA_END=704 /DNA_ORIENTATION=-
MPSAEDAEKSAEKSVEQMNSGADQMFAGTRYYTNAKKYKDIDTVKLTITDETVFPDPVFAVKPFD